MSETNRGVIQMTLAMVISGSIGWFVLMSGRPVNEVVFWRCAIGSISFLALCWHLGLLQVRLSFTQSSLAIGGGIAIVLNWLLLFAAYSRASISIATAVYNVQPFILTIMGSIFLGEKLATSKLLWLVLAFAGVTLLVLSAPSAGGSDYALGIIMAFTAAFGWATAALTTKKLKGVPPQLIALIHTLTGTIMLLPFAGWAGTPVSTWSWSLLTIMGVVHTGIMYALMYSAVQRLPTYLQGALSFIYPIVAILVDVLVLGHRLQPLQVLGGLVILAAVAAMTFGVRLPYLQKANMPN